MIDLKVARSKFRTHKSNAKKRKAPFLFTFEEWVGLWKASGHWEQRGCGKGKYVMSRLGDVGPYSVENVKIILHEDNLREQWERPETLQKIRKALVGNTYARGYKHTPTAIKKMLGNQNGVGRKAPRASSEELR